MSKRLNEWLDEFIENGADPENVTEWPENAGGGGEIITLEGGVEKEYVIVVDELLKLIKNVTDSRYGIGDVVYSDDSGSDVHSCIVLSTYYSDSRPSRRAIWMNGSEVASVAEGSFSSWYDFVNDSRAAIETRSIHLNSGTVFVGVVRGVGDHIIETFDISKLLIEQEPQQEL